MQDKFLWFLRSRYAIIILGTKLSRVRDEIEETVIRDLFFKKKGYETTPQKLEA